MSGDGVGILPTECQFCADTGMTSWSKPMGAGTDGRVVMVPVPQICACKAGDKWRNAQSFAKHPVSLTEAKAYRDNDCTKLSPRDALIRTLREIDAGEYTPDALVICWRSKKDGEDFTHCRHASPDPLVTTGMLVKAALDLWA